MSASKSRLNKIPEIVELTPSQLGGLFDRLEGSNLSDNDKRLFKGLAQSHIWLKHKYHEGKVNLHKLANLLFGNKSEKRERPGERRNREEGGVTSAQSNNESKEEPTSENLSQESQENVHKHDEQEERTESKKSKGHGRLGADDYLSAENVTIDHPSLKPGDACPEECGGKLYSMNPGVVIRITGQDIAKATRYHLQKLRCSSCGLIVNAPIPEGVSEKKYDNRFKAILAIQKYFVGVPFYRQEDFQELMGFPLPDSTQWDLAEQVANSIHPIFTALEKKAAQADVVYNDDTPVKIVEVMQLNKKDPNRKRKGTFTTGIYAQFNGGLMIALYYSGALHAGENLGALLKHRAKGLKPLIHMCDALS